MSPAWGRLNRICGDFCHIDRRLPCESLKKLVVIEDCFLASQIYLLLPWRIRFPARRYDTAKSIFPLKDNSCCLWAGLVSRNTRFYCRPGKTFGLFIDHICIDNYYYCWNLLTVPVVYVIGFCKDIPGDKQYPPSVALNIFYRELRLHKSRMIIRMR